MSGRTSQRAMAMTNQPAGEPMAQQLADRVERLHAVDGVRYRRLWAYCHNPLRVGATLESDTGQERPYRQAQEWGLPPRITGVRSGADIGSDTSDVSQRKEVVIENDIGWRIETMIDYLFGRPIVLTSSAPDPARGELIGSLLRQILAGNGGILMLQQLALLGSVYGFVDVLVKLDTNAGTNAIEEDSTACGTEQLGEPPAGQGSADGQRSSDAAGAGEGDAGPTQAQSAPQAGDGAPADAGDVASTRAASDHSQKATDQQRAGARLGRLARMVRFEVVEPARAVPFLCPSDWRKIEAYAQVLASADATQTIEFREGASGGSRWLDLLRRVVSPRRLLNGSDSPRCAVELITPTKWYRYQNGKVVAEGENSLGRVPVVHIQNTAIPFSYSGGSDVEPLIPLQDELNTRLSDRAQRITLQSFKMYLGKNIEGFDKLPVAPGRMWMSDDKDADVIEFGGDSSCPSEDTHIGEVREALDKASGVTPIAAGAVEGRIGHLTSAVALRVTLQALLAKTEKKRTTYGTAIAEMCELALAWLDRAGLFATTPDERRVELSWPSPIPENETEKLQDAEAKVRLGVPREVVLRELGY